MARPKDLSKLTGRPTKFKIEYIQQMIDFFNGEAMRKEVMETVTEYGANGQPRKTAEKYKYLPNKMPTIYGFAKKIGVPYTTVWRWAEKGEDDELETDKPETKEELTELESGLKLFCNAYKTAKMAQQEFLMEIGLAGAAPPSAYIFTAKNVTPMRDKVESEVTHKVERPLLDNLRKPTHAIRDNNSDGESFITPEED